MIKGKDILGRHVVAIDSGQRIDSVQDLIFDHQANEVLGLLVDEGGWFRAAKVVPFELVRSIGDDAIMIDSAEHVTTTRDDDRLADLLDSKISLIGMTLLTTEGQDLGKIADVYFNEESGKVEGYEATGGIFSDLSNGRTFVPAPENVQIGEDAAVVPVSVANAMQEQEPGGLRGAFSSAGDSIRGAYGNIADATKERQKEYAIGKTAGGDITLDDGTVIVSRGEVITAEHAEQAEQRGKLGALATTATGGAISGAYDNIAGASRDRQKEYVIGKEAGGDLLADDGSTIVTRGQIITAEQAEQAEREGKLTALATNATGGVIIATYGDARDRVQGGREGVTAVSVSPEAAIGRRARTEVRSPSGSLVAAQGQIVTAAIVERAQHLGVENELLDATLGRPAQSGGTDTRAALADGLDNVSSGASNLLDRAKGWLGERREDAETALDERQQKAHEQRIKDALGRPVNRVILAPDDSIILNLGEIVTHKAVELAQQGDVLDILLDSVSKETPDINPLASRPDEHGRGALDSQPDLGTQRITTDPKPQD